VSALVDEEARRRIREDLDATLIVEAAAGTGKTTALVSRIVAVLREGRAELDRIVAVTFTELAAGEMKLRLRADLEAARLDPSVTAEQQVRLDRALSQLEAARISTIHSLCADLLRERPIEARVDPLFGVASDDEAQRLFDVAFDRWFQQSLEDPPEGVRRVLRKRRRGRDDGGPRDTLRAAAWDLMERRDFKTPWRRERFERDAEIDKLLVLLEDVGSLGAKADWEGDFLARPFVKIARFVDEVRRAEGVRPRDHDGLEAELPTLLHDSWDWSKPGRGDFYSRKHQLRRADVVATRDQVRESLKDFLDRTQADLAAALQHALLPLAERYDAVKRRAGKLDFLDLLLRTRDLVVSDATIRAELQRRFTHVFVDEFQDTDPMQAEILMLIAGSDPSERDWTRSRPPPGKLFVVGDPKQSIYRFRRADVALYEQVKRSVQAQGGSVLHLQTSFRGAPDIQAMVNAAFAPVMRANPEGTQAEYVALQAHRPPHPSQPAVVVLPVPRPYSESGWITQKAIDASLPDAVGAFVAWLVRESGFTVTEREGGSARVPVEARHVCLLFKRLTSWSAPDLTRAYVQALEARDVPHVLVGGRSFHTREEVTAVRAALAAIEWPDDELAVYATLRGPFFALSDEQLLVHRAQTNAKIIHPMRRGDTPSEVTDALSVLAGLHAGRNRRPIADTLGRLFEETRAHAGVAIWPTGEQSLANVLRLIELARRFEASGATSFRAFLDWLDDAALRGQTSEAPVVEEGTDGVRIMTVHKAKGLEFPVVILVDPNAKIPSRPSRHVDHVAGVWAEQLAGCAPLELLENEEDVLRRDREEAVRVAYVAATRARDLLVVPAVGDDPKDPNEAQDGWLSVLDPALRPARDKRRTPEVAEGCPKFGRDSVLERPFKANRDENDSIAPGAHTPHSGAHRVVWWDPSRLSLGVEADVGLRQQTILAPRGDQRDLVDDASAKTHLAWRTRRQLAITRGAVPTMHVVSVSQLAEAAAGLAATAPPSIPVERTDADRTGSPRGKRFGTLLHAVLEHAPFDAAEDRLRVLAQAHGRFLGAEPAEIEAAVGRVASALRHPLLRRAAESARCRREAPVSARLSDGSILEGVVDLVFHDSEGWLVIDFKTDTDVERNRTKYEVQLQAYVAAIVQATGEPARAVLLSI
jgi:ATP-dependent helicase/nuclease subunit A